MNTDARHPATRRATRGVRAAVVAGLAGVLAVVGAAPGAVQNTESDARVAAIGAYGGEPRFAALLTDGSSVVGALRGLGDGVLVVGVEDALGVPGEERAVELSSVAAVLPIDTRADAALGLGAPAPLGRVSRVLRADAVASSASSELGVLELVDGQRLVGSIDREAAGEDVLGWVLPGGERVSVPLERVARVVDAEANRRVVPVPKRTGDDDVLVLLNGDALRGFVLGFAPGASIETDGGIVDVPGDRVAGAALANPAEPATGALVALVDGSVVHAASLSTASGSVTAVSHDGWSISAGLDEVRAIVPRMASLVSLASLEPVSVEPLGDRLFADAPRAARPVTDTAPASGATLGVMDLPLEGPVRVRYDVPEGASVFAATIGPGELDARWADGTVAVLIDGVAWASVPADMIGDGVPVRADVRGASRLTVEYRPGEHGGVGAAVRLHRPVFVLD